MGKSAAGQGLVKRGLPVVDSDEIAREVCAPGEPALDEIRERFGSETLDSDGSLRRSELAKRVFGDDAARRDLEAILHPRIRTSWMAAAERWRSEGRVAGAVQIPLLYETHAEGEFDAVVCLACSRPIQMNRLLARGWDERQIAARIESQTPIGEKMERSDFVIWNDSGISELGEQLDRILRTLNIAATD